MSLNEGDPASPDKHIQFEAHCINKNLEQVQSAKYIGITISDDLDWGQHISEISAKATKTLRFLWRNLAFAPIGTLRKLHTKHWFALSSSMQHLFGIPIMKLGLDRWRRYSGQLPGGPDLKLNLNSLLVKRQIDNPSPGAVTGGTLALTREVNVDTLSSDSSEEEIRDSGRSFQSLIVWGKKL